MRIINRDETIATIRTLVETRGYRDWPSTTEYEEQEPVEEGAEDYQFVCTYTSPDGDMVVTTDEGGVTVEILSDSPRRYDPHSTICFYEDGTLGEVVWRENGKITD